MIDKQRSKMIGGVVLLNIIGRGAHSEVQRGLIVLQGEEKEVAVKIVSKTSLSVRLVEDEIALLRRINHPNVVTFLNRCETSNNHYLVTELCSRGNFRDFMRCNYHEGCVPEAHARHYLHQVCCGLAEIHRQDIAHRDLKAENIFITQDFVIKIGDFGFAKQAGELSILSSFKGTPVNMAPEIFYAHRKKGAFYDKKCDIWSLGTLLYEMIYGHVIGDVKNVNDLHLLLSNEKEIPFPSTKSISLSCRSMLQLLLRKKSSDRPCISEVLSHEFFHQNENSLMLVANLLRDAASTPHSSIILDNFFFDKWHVEYFIGLHIKNLLKNEIMQLVTRVAEVLRKLENLIRSSINLPRTFGEIKNFLSTYISWHLNKLSTIKIAPHIHKEVIGIHISQLIEENKKTLGLDQHIITNDICPEKLDGIRESLYCMFFDLIEYIFKYEFEEELQSIAEKAHIKFVYEYILDLFNVLSFDYEALLYKIEFLRPINLSFDPTDIGRYFIVADDNDKIFSTSICDFLHSLFNVTISVCYKAEGMSSKLSEEVKNFILLTLDKRFNICN